MQILRRQTPLGPSPASVMYRVATVTELILNDLSTGLWGEPRVTFVQCAGLIYLLVSFCLVCNYVETLIYLSLSTNRIFFGVFCVLAQPISLPPHPNPCWKDSEWAHDHLVFDVFFSSVRDLGGRRTGRLRGCRPLNLWNICYTFTVISGSSVAHPQFSIRSHY